MFKKFISKIIQRIRKKREIITLEEAIRLKQVLYEEIENLKTQVVQLDKSKLTETKPTDSTDYKVLLSLFKLLKEKTQKYQHVSNKILEANIRTKNHIAIKQKEVWMRLRYILQSIPNVNLQLPGRLFGLSKPYYKVTSLIGALDRQIQRLTKKLESTNKKTYIQV